MDSRHLRVFVALSLIFGHLHPSDGKLCCEPECRKPISYGRTQQRYITKDKDFLSYPSSAIVTVLAKGAYFGENGEEFWEAEIQGKHGLIRSTAINEMTYKCQPQDFGSKKEEGKMEDGLPGAGTTSEETNHQSNSDQIPPMAEEDKTSGPLESQPDVTQPPTQGRDERFDKPPAAADTPSDSRWKMEDEEENKNLRSDDLKQQEEPPHDEVNHLGDVKVDPNLASVSAEYKATEVHQDEKPVKPDQLGTQTPMASQTLEHFIANQQASKENENAQRQPHVHKLFETPPPTVTPPPDAALPDEMLAMLTPSPQPNDERLVKIISREGHVTYANGRSDQLPPVMQGNLPQENDESSSGAPQQSNHTSEARSPESGSPEDSNVGSEEGADHIGDSGLDSGRDREKEDLKHTNGQFDSQFVQPEDDKPPSEDSVPSESETTTFDSGQTTSDPKEAYHSDTNQQNEEDKYVDDDNEDDDDDYYDDHYWDDVPEPEYTGNVNTGQVDEPPSLFEPLEEKEREQRSPTQEVSEEREKEGEEAREEYSSTVISGDNSSGDLSQGQTQPVDKLPSSDNTQSDTRTAPSEAPPTEAPPSEVSSSEAPPTEFPPPDTYQSEFSSPETVHPPSEVQPDSDEDKAPPSGPDAPPSEVQPSSFDNQTPPSKAETETPSSESPPPSQHDGNDRQQVGTASKPDPSLHGVSDIDLQSIGLPPSHLRPSPSVTQLPGGGQEADLKTDSEPERDDHVEQAYSSRLPSEEQKQEPKNDDTVVDGTYLPDYDEDDDDVVRTTPFQSPVFTPPVVSTPIPGSDSTNVGAGDESHAQESLDLEQIKARTEQLRAQLDNEYHQTTADGQDSNADSRTVQETRTDQERAGMDDDTSSTVADQQSETRRDDARVPAADGTHNNMYNEHPQATPTVEPVEATPNQVPAEIDQSQATFEDGATQPPPYNNAYESEEGEASGEDTPTPPPMDADSAFEEPPPPPRMSYSCRDDYLPMPGHNRGGWMAYHEQVRARIRDFVLDALPSEWSDWVCHNRPTMAVIMTSVVCFSLFAPLLMIWCLSGRSGKQKLKEVQIKLANYRKLEEDLSKAQNDKSVLERKLRESEDRCQNLQDKITLQKQEFDGLAREKGEIEAHYHSVTGALTTAQLEISQYLANTEQLNIQISHLQSQVTAVVNEREGALQQATDLSATIQELEQKVQGLEAQKDQLEEDRFTSQTALQELQSQHEQVKAELEETKEQCEGLKNDLGSVTADLEAKIASITEREEELQILRSCLSQVTEQAAATADDVVDGGASPSPGGETAGEEGEDVGERKQMQLEKIQAMLNTTKVQLELRETTEERDRLFAELREKTTKLEEQIAENEQLNASYCSLETKEQETSFKLKELELKMKGVKEYFQEKERELHKRIEVGEVSRMHYEQLESEAQEKATVADQERQRERQELTELRDQITEIEKSYSNQIKNTELRAGDAIASLRRTEQELRQANREITVLRRRLSELENVPPPLSVMRPIPARGPGYPPLSRTRPPSTGPPSSHEGGLQPPRPISAPRLDPRTSSPSGFESLGPLPSLPAVPRAVPSSESFHKSQSSGAMHNTSLPPLGTPGIHGEGPNRPGSRGVSNDLSLSGHPSSTSLTNLPPSSHPAGEQRAGERLPPSRQAPPPQARPASMGRPPLRTPPVPTTGPVPPPPSAAPGRPIPPPPHPGRVPPYGGYPPPPQPYAGGAPRPPPPGGRMYRGPPPSTSGRPYPPPPHSGGQYPPGPPRQPMAPPSSGGRYRPPPPGTSGAPPPPPPGGRIRTPGPPPSGYPIAAAGERPPAPSQPHNSSWQQPPPPQSRGHPAQTHDAWNHCHPYPPYCHNPPHSRYYSPAWSRQPLPPYHSYYRCPYYYNHHHNHRLIDVPLQRPVSSAVSAAAHLTDNDSSHHHDRPMARPAPINRLTAESGTKAKSCDTPGSQGNPQTEHAQWMEDKCNSLSGSDEQKDSYVSSGSDSGIQSASSTPIETAHQSAFDFEATLTKTTHQSASVFEATSIEIAQGSAPYFEATPTEATHQLLTSDFEVNVHYASPPHSSTQACHLTFEENKPLAANSGIAAQPTHSTCEGNESSVADIDIITNADSPLSSLAPVSLCEESSPNGFTKSVNPLPPLIDPEANYSACERDTPSALTAKTVHFTSPLATLLACKENKADTDFTAVHFTSPPLTQATHPVCVPHYEEESSPSNASVASADSDSTLPPLIEATCNYPATAVPSPAHPVFEESKRLTADSIIAATVQFPPPPLTQAPAYISHYEESSPDSEIASTESVDSMPPLIDPDTECGHDNDTPLATAATSLQSAVCVPSVAQAAYLAGFPHCEESGPNAPTESVDPLPPFIDPEAVCERDTPSATISTTLYSAESPGVAQAAHLVYDENTPLTADNGVHSLSPPLAQNYPSPQENFVADTSQTRARSSDCDDGKEPGDGVDDSDPDKTEGEDDLMATLFMNFCYPDEREDKQTKSKKKKNASLAANNCVAATTQQSSTPPPPTTTTQAVFSAASEESYPSATPFSSLPPLTQSTYPTHFENNPSSEYTGNAANVHSAPVTPLTYSLAADSGFASAIQSVKPPPTQESTYTFSTHVAQQENNGREDSPSPLTYPAVYPSQQENSQPLRANSGIAATLSPTLTLTDYLTHTADSRSAAYTDITGSTLTEDTYTACESKSIHSMSPPILTQTNHPACDNNPLAVCTGIAATVESLSPPPLAQTSYYPAYLENNPLSAFTDIAENISPPLPRTNFPACENSTASLPYTTAAATCTNESDNLPSMIDDTYPSCGNKSVCPGPPLTQATMYTVCVKKPPLKPPYAGFVSTPSMTPSSSKPTPKRMAFVPDDDDLHVHDRRKKGVICHPLHRAIKARRRSTFSFSAFTGEGTGNIAKENSYGAARV